jgi:1,2-diacylglycerol 3-beta-galactosyltransferase
MADQQPDRPNDTAPRKPRIVFLFSDTGGGHRSAAEAIIEALELEFPGRYDTEMIDFFKDYSPPPLSYAPDIYPPISRFPDVWGFYYHISDGKRRTRAVNNLVYPYVSRAIHKLVRENPADLFVSVHPLVNTPVLRAMRKVPRRFMTVVTDMVSTHAFWYDRRADLVVVPTDQARERGKCYGVPEEKIKVVGLPVANKFCNPPADRDALRDRLGWRKDKPVIMLVGGGEGMGPLEQVAHAINESGMDTALVVICGRNKSLHERLEHHEWNIPVYIYGFVREMPDFMAASDILVTKAGPGTICEAFIAGLPLVIYSHMPGQEDGNVFYVVDEKAGIWAPHPERVVEALRLWIEHPEERLKAAENCRRVAKPDASRQIARLIAEQLQKPLQIQEEQHSRFQLPE